MSGVADTVQMTIALDAPTVPSAALGRILLAGSNPAFTERYRLYSSAAALLADAEAQVTSSDWEYKALAAIYAQRRTPSDVAVGRVDTSSFAAQVVDLDVTAGSDDGDYTVTINGIAYTYTAASATSTVIMTALHGLINAGTENVTSVDGVDGTAQVTSDTAGDGFTVSVSSPNDNLTATVSTANAGWAEELDAILAAYSDFYYVNVGDRTDAVIEDVAAWCETNKRVFVAQTDEAATGVSATTTDLASKLKALAYDRTALLYYSSDAVAADAGITGRKGSVDPDVKSTSWAHATIAGVAYDELTTTFQAAAEGKNANVYQKYAGVGVFWEGKVASGRYIDVIISADWLETRMKEDLQQFFLNVSARDDKVPYTDEGIRQVASVIRNRLSVGQTVGHLDPEVQPRLQVPSRASIPDATVASRELTIPFQAQLAGAIHKVAVDGAVVVTLPPA